ncbi:ferredoxin [Lentzea flava]|uniref:Ferredoxin n=1 Tax=Lentzea flava TaxID=103732 RepID=A0ABQ2VIV9_9PSEU|nr:ferredoxin [Lentzea flava]MCP2205313.1 Ferredoxin [Lentzea flava]GGU85438.1 hypothetical protein GCM10010178_89490 [Lentzea flava]
MRLTVDEHLCGTTGQCVLIAPELFRQRADGVAEVLAAELSEEHDEDAQEAILGCPVGAISTHN